MNGEVFSPPIKGLDIMLLWGRVSYRENMILLSPTTNKHDAHVGYIGHFSQMSVFP